MIELCCEYLSVQRILLYVIIMSRKHFRVNLHSIFAWMSINYLLEKGAKSEVVVGSNPVAVTNKYCSYISTKKNRCGWQIV